MIHAYDLVTGRVRWLVEVDDTGADVRLEVTTEGRAASGNRGEVTSPDKHYSSKNVNVGWVKQWSFRDKRTLLIVLEQKRPNPPY